MPKGYALGAVVLALLAGGCGGDAEQCDGSVAVTDPVGDPRSDVRLAEAAPPPPPSSGLRPLGLFPPSADLTRFELHASSAGICARWTTATPAPTGTTFVLIPRGPPERMPSRAIVWPTYTFETELLERGGRVTGRGRTRPLQAQVGRSGNTVSVFVPRAELPHVPVRIPVTIPLFPYRSFTFETEVYTPPETRSEHYVEQSVDCWPDQSCDVAYAAGYIDGELCEPPCRHPVFSNAPATPLPTTRAEPP